MTDLVPLVCGKQETPCLAKEALTKIAASIERLSSKCLAILSSPFDDDARLYGPFCARALMENACAAIVGRIDPFRLVYLAHFQAREEYDPSKRIKTAFNWSGDVISPDKPNKVLWSCDHDMHSISRSLFSQYNDALFWQPALEGALDMIKDIREREALSDFLRLEPESFIESTKGRYNRIYPFLSKGIHFEFFDPVTSIDELSLKSAIRETCLLLARLGLVSHFMPTAYGSLDVPDAINHYTGFCEQIA